MTTVRIGGDNELYQMSYERSWSGILSKYVQFRCRLCPDSTGEFADISCGDLWCQDIEPDEPGKSLVLVRTDRGRRILHAAVEAGYIELKKVVSEMVSASQSSLLNKRQNLFGRLMAMHIMRIPVPHFEGFSLFSNWLALPVIEKARSMAGSFKRIFRRNWNKPLKSLQEK
jgi:coenzyme F420 hydrogenase subunit beta